MYSCVNIIIMGFFFSTEALLLDTDWSYEEELELLKEEITHVADQCRADETKKMLNQIEVNWL